MYVEEVFEEPKKRKTSEIKRMSRKISRLEMMHQARMEKEPEPLWVRKRIEEETKNMQEDDKFEYTVVPSPRLSPHEEIHRDGSLSLGLREIIQEPFPPVPSQNISRKPIQSVKRYQDTAVQTIGYNDSGSQTVSEEQLKEYESSCGAALDIIHEANYVSEQQLIQERIRNQNLKKTYLCRTNI